MALKGFQHLISGPLRPRLWGNEDKDNQSSLLWTLRSCGVGVRFNIACKHLEAKHWSGVLDKAGFNCHSVVIYCLLYANGKSGPAQFPGQAGLLMQTTTEMASGIIPVNKVTYLQ